MSPYWSFDDRKFNLNDCQSFFNSSSHPANNNPSFANQSQSQQTPFTVSNMGNCNMMHTGGGGSGMTRVDQQQRSWRLGSTNYVSYSTPTGPPSTQMMFGLYGAAHHPKCTVGGIATTPQTTTTTHKNSQTKLWTMSLSNVGQQTDKYAPSRSATASGHVRLLQYPGE